MVFVPDDDDEVLTVLMYGIVIAILWCCWRTGRCFGIVDDFLDWFSNLRWFNSPELQNRPRWTHTSSEEWLLQRQREGEPESTPPYQSTETV